MQREVRGAERGEGSSLTFQLCPPPSTGTTCSRAPEGSPELVDPPLEHPRLLLLVLPDGIGRDGLLVHLQGIDDCITHFLSESFLVLV